MTNHMQPGQPQPRRSRAASKRTGSVARLGLEILEDRTVLSAAPTSVVSLSGLSVQSAYDPSHILVEFGSGATPHALAGTWLGGSVPGSDVVKVYLKDGTTVSGAIQQYKADRTVATAEPDYLLQSSAVPNDAQFGQQWSLQNTGQNGGIAGADIHATQAWNVTTGSSRVIVSVMDTGVDYTHPDLYDNIWINQKEIPASRLKNLVDYYHDGFISMRDLNDPRNQGVGKITDVNNNGFIDGGDLLAPMVKDASGHDTGRGGWADGVSEDGSGYVDDIIGWNFFNNTNNPYDDYGHGTHVAGTIGAMGNNGTGISGIDWNVQLMPVKFLGSGGAGSISQFIQALNYAVANGAIISNNSWSGATNSTLLSDAINNARNHGMIFVAAAGNFSSDNDTQPAYPASFKLDNLVSVAASDSSDRLASFSDYGQNSVTIAAPGVNILSTLPGGKYGVLSGTSMATPHVTGVLALVWSQHPNWNYKQVINQVMQTVDKVSSLSDKTITGGRVDAAAAVGVAQVAASPLHIVDSQISGPTAASYNKITVKFDHAVSLPSFTPADVHLSGTDGSAISIASINAVAGSGNQMFNLSFATQTRGGYYRLQIGPNLTDLSGSNMAVFNSSFYLQAALPPTPVPVPLPRPTTAPTLHIIDSRISGPTSASYNKITVKFDHAVTSSFTAAAVHLTGPSGNAITITGIRPVAGSGNQSFDLSFATQTRGGYYRLQVGPGVSDRSGTGMVVFNSSFYLNAAPSTSTTTPPPVPTPVPTPPPVVTPTAQTFTSTDQVNVPASGRGVSMLFVTQHSTIQKVRIKINIAAPSDGDLLIHVQSPDGTNIVLSNRKGGSSSNFVNTVFDDGASTYVALGRGPFTGSFQPDAALANLAGKNASGVWKLWVEDKGGNNRSTLINWSVILN